MKHSLYCLSVSNISDVCSWATFAHMHDFDFFLHAIRLDYIMFVCVLLPSGVMSGCVEHGLYCCPRKKGGVIWQRFFCHYWFAAREPDSYRVLGHECADFFAVFDLDIKEKNPNNTCDVRSVGRDNSSVLTSITHSSFWRTYFKPSCHRHGNGFNQAVIGMGTGGFLWSQLPQVTKHEGWHITNSANTPFFLLSLIQVQGIQRTQWLTCTTAFTDTYVVKCALDHTMHGKICVQIQVLIMKSVEWSWTPSFL